MKVEIGQGEAALGLVLRCVEPLRRDPHQTVLVMPMPPRYARRKLLPLPAKHAHARSAVCPRAVLTDPELIEGRSVSRSIKQEVKKCVNGATGLKGVHGSYPTPAAISQVLPPDGFAEVGQCLAGLLGAGRDLVSFGAASRAL
jgi:hypothetical protein